MNKLLIKELQYYQFLHDNVGHMDIVVLPVKQRITHLNLHLTKYFNAQHEPWRAVDALACLLSMANTLNTDIGKILSTSTNTPVESIEDIPLIFAGNLHLSKLVLRDIGAISKMLEGLDHIEPLNYRFEIGNMIANIFHIVLHDYSFRYGSDASKNFYRNTLNLIHQYFQRLGEVRSKHIFHLQFEEKLESDPNFGGFEIRVKHVLGEPP